MALLSSFSKQYIEAGLDEVGRGCLAGPVVAAAVVLPKDFSHALLTDSKQMKAAQRLEAEQDIKAAALAWAVAEVSPEEIDCINILKASFKAMHLALDQLREQYPAASQPELLLIDGNRFAPYGFIAHQCIVKGDSKYYSIAAASVLAKNYRDALMERLAQEYPHYGWEQNVGYPTVAHRKAIALHGLSPYHRKSFKVSLEAFS